MSLNDIWKDHNHYYDEELDKVEKCQKNFGIHLE